MNALLNLVAEVFFLDSEIENVRMMDKHGEGATRERVGGASDDVVDDGLMLLDE
jgi:hypothetical protein